MAVIVRSFVNYRIHESLYEQADSFEIVDGILFVTDGERTLAAYAPGQWLDCRVMNEPMPKNDD